MQSEGLLIAEGKIVGLGECKDTVLYLNMPIEEGAFYYDTIPYKVYLGNGVTSIGANAFAESSIKELVFFSGPYTFEEATDGTYRDTSINKIYINDLEAYLSAEAFSYSPFGSGANIDFYYKNELLTDLVIPENVEFNNLSAFQGYDKLESVSLPSTFGGSDKLLPRMFKGCIGLKNLTVAEANPYYYSDGNCIITKDTKMLELVGCNVTSIPDGVKGIRGGGDSAFVNLLSTELTVPDSVAGSFKINNSYIKTVNIGINSGIESVDFSGCSALEDITLPDSVTNMGKFSGCTNLKTVKLGKGIKSLPVVAFADCSSLEKVWINNAELESIGNSAFWNCTSLSEIHFAGTKADWENITKTTNAWNGNTGNYVIYCANNEIILKADP